jgi:hypothetical protein
MVMVYLRLFTVKAGRCRYGPGLVAVIVIIVIWITAVIRPAITWICRIGRVCGIPGIRVVIGVIPVIAVRRGLPRIIAATAGVVVSRGIIIIIARIAVVPIRPSAR